MLTRRLLIGVVLGSGWVLAPSVRAADSPKAQGSGLWNINIMVKQAADQIIDRYKLNDEQADYTRQLMSRRVNKLLDKHEATVRALFREAMAMRLAGKPPTAEAIQSWAERAGPVYQDARHHIIEGNKEWGGILSPEQRKIHEEDLEDMEESFAEYEQKLERWSEGGFDAKKDWRINRTQRRQPRRPRPSKTVTPKRPPKANTKGQPNRAAAKPKPPANAPKKGPIIIGGEPRKKPPAGQEAQDRVILDPEHFWDVYVRNFASKYGLDSAQRGQARAILKDCKERARRHRDAHRDDYVRLHGLIRRHRAAPGPGLTRVNEELVELDAPINDLFEELKSRLDRIPTSAQIRKHEAAQQK
jgi:hypothetical protein